MKIPTICENETNCFTNCGYWQYQQIAIKKLENFTFQSCILWVLNLWQQKRNTKWSTNCSTNVSNLESAKWSGVRPALLLRFFNYVNPKNKDGLTPLHMATINIQSLKYVNIVLQKKFKKKDGCCIWSFQQFSILYFNLYQNDKWLNKADMWNGVNTSLIYGFSQ